MADGLKTHRYIYTYKNVLYSLVVIVVMVDGGLGYFFLLTRLYYICIERTVEKSWKEMKGVFSLREKYPLGCRNRMRSSRNKHKDLSVLLQENLGQMYWK